MDEHVSIINNQRQNKSWSSLSYRCVLAFSFLTFVRTVFATEDVITVNSWNPAYDYRKTPEQIAYRFALPATKNWRLCSAYPHLKDAYWLGVNYGMVMEAERLGVELQIVEAGGYPNLERQKVQIRSCGLDPKIDAVIVGTVTFDGLRGELSQLAEQKPVLATVNDISDLGVSAKTGVSWYQMGHLVGKYLLQRHSGSAESIPIAWFPGPKDAGWVPFVDRGFRDAIADSVISIDSTHWGDTGKSIQRNLVQDALTKPSKIRYLVGNALMAEAAISLLAERQLSDRIQVLSTYFTPGVYRGIMRKKILAAPTDSPVLQGKLAISQAVNVLEKRRFIKHMGPLLKLIDQQNVRSIDLDTSLAPSAFTPQFLVTQKK